MKKMFFGMLLSFVLAGCSMFDAPEGTAVLAGNSVCTRTERPTASEEIVYCSCDVMVTNTCDRTIYGFTLTAVAASDKGVEHYISSSYEVTIPPYQSVYVTVEWTLVRQIETSSVTVSGTEAKGSSKGHSESTSKSDSGTLTADRDTDPESTYSSTHTDGTTGTDDKTETEDHSKTTSTTTTVVTVNTDGETAWNMDSVRILDCFFN